MHYVLAYANLLTYIPAPYSGHTTAYLAFFYTRNIKYFYWFPFFISVRGQLRKMPHSVLTGRRSTDFFFFFRVTKVTIFRRNCGVKRPNTMAFIFIAHCLAAMFQDSLIFWATSNRTMSNGVSCRYTLIIVSHPAKNQTVKSGLRNRMTFNGPQTPGLCFKLSAWFWTLLKSPTNTFLSTNSSFYNHPQSSDSFVRINMLKICKINFVSDAEQP